MKKAFINFFLLTSMFFLICSSGKYSDPLEGGYLTGCVGVFGGKYEKNIEQRRNLLASLQHDTEQMKMQLRKAEIVNQSRLEQKMILENELLNLQEEIEKYQRYLKELEEKKEKIDSSEEAEMVKELRRLMKEKARLQQQIEELAAM